MANGLDRLEETMRREIGALRELIELRLGAAQDALVLQAQKDKDHFLDLNHAHEKAIAEQNRTVARDMFEQYRQSQAEALQASEVALQAWKDAVNKQLVTQSASSAATSKTIGIFFTVVNLLIAMLSWLGMRAT